MHPQSFSKNGQNGGQNAANGQTAIAVSAPPIAPPQPDPTPNTFNLDDPGMVRIQSSNKNIAD
jgi:hypothetical protein